MRNNNSFFVETTVKKINEYGKISGMKFIGFIIPYYRNQNSIFTFLTNLVAFIFFTLQLRNAR